MPHLRPRLHQRLGQLIPNGIAARLAMTMVLLLVVVQAIGALVYLVSRPEHRPVPSLSVISSRIAATVHEIERTPSRERHSLAEAIEDPDMAVAWEANRPAEGGWSEMPLRRFRQMLMQDLGGPERPVIAEVRDDPALPPPPPHGGMHIGIGNLFPFGQIKLSVGLADGSWVIFTRKDPFGGPFRLVRFALWTALTAVAVAGLSLWAARVLTAPLGRFASAADRLGVDSAAPPLPEDGPAELRAATRAINRMQERLHRFVADRTRMLAAIGHDLRTPLTRLRLRAEFVEEPELQRKMLADLAEMEAMISATLAFARDDAEREACVATDLADLLQSLCDDRVDAGDDATYHGPNHLPVRCRPVALRRALANLIDNALHYGGAARIRLAQSGSEITIVIEDDGPGIPEDEQEKVFAPFYRLEGSRSRDTGGTGLGLSVARTIVRGHGGDIVLANRQPHGLSAHVTLPA